MVIKYVEFRPDSVHGFWRLSTRIVFWRWESPRRSQNYTFDSKQKNHLNEKQLSELADILRAVLVNIFIIFELI